MPVFGEDFAEGFKVVKGGFGYEGVHEMAIVRKETRTALAEACQADQQTYLLSIG